MMRRLQIGLLVSCLSVELLAMQAGKQIVRVGEESNLPFSPAVKAGGFIFVSGTLATDDKGQVVRGDVKAQTRRVLDTIGRVLKAAGTGLEHAVAMHVYLKNAADFPAMNEAYATYWQKDPPTRTTVVTNLVRPDALVEIASVAVAPGAGRQVVHPATWNKSPSPYSYGIKSGDTLFLAGLISRNGKDNSVVPGDMATQTKTVLDNGAEILQAAGMSFADVVSSRVFITDVAMREDMNKVYRTYFPKDPPARATVRTGLTGPQYLVEITMVAVKGPPRQAVTTPGADGTPGRTNPNLSSAIQVGNRLYVSGILGNTETNKGDAGAQTRETLARIGRTLKAAGFDWSHVVDGVVYLTDLKNYQAMNGSYREVFAKDFPARATVETGLLAPDGLVEIMVTAIK